MGKGDTGRDIFASGLFKGITCYCEMGKKRGGGALKATRIAAVHAWGDVQSHFCSDLDSFPSAQSYTQILYIYCQSEKI